MQDYRDRLMRRFAASAIAFALSASHAWGTITLTSAPTAVDNGETTNIVAVVTSSKTVAGVQLETRFVDWGGNVGNGYNYFDMEHGESDDEYVICTPILPAGVLRWHVVVKYTDGTSEQTTGKVFGWNVTTNAAAFSYNRFHDMRGLTGILSQTGTNYCESTYGWVQDKSALGSMSTNFYAAAPNGSQWKASGVGWAYGRRNTSAYRERLPYLGSAADLNGGGALTFPVLFFLNLPPESKPFIRSPKFSDGVGTISVDVQNVGGTTSKLQMQVAYTDGDPEEDDWSNVGAELELTATGPRSWTNVVNDSAATYVRILRTQRNTGSTSPQVGFIGIDNFCVTPPTPDVVLQERLRNPGYPSAANDTTIYCLVSNVLSRIPAINRTVSAHYYLASSASESVASNLFSSTNLTYVCETNGCSLYSGKIPALGSAGWLHYYFQCDFQGYYYTSPTENGLASPKYYDGAGSTSTAPTSDAATHLRCEVRNNVSRYSGIQVMQIVDGVSTNFYDMTLVADNQWQVSVTVDEGTSTESYFVGANCYEAGADTFLLNPYYHGDTNQDEPYDTPTGGTPERQYGTTANLPGIVIEIDADGYMVYRFDDADDASGLNYTIRRGVFQNFDDWEEEGLYYVESLYGAGVGTRETGFDDWEQPYGWLAADNSYENFQLCASNSEFSVYADIVPRDATFIENETATPNNWMIENFRITNERVTNNTARFAYGGSSNVVAQIRPGGNLYNLDSSLPEGVGLITAVMRASVADGAKARYTGQKWGYSSSTPLSVNTSFTIPSADRANSHYFASIVFDYQDESNYHELRFTRGDSSDANDSRLILELAEVYNGDERKVAHKNAFTTANPIKNDTAIKVTASIAYSGTTVTVTLTTITIGGNNVSGWANTGNAISLSNCHLLGSTAAYVGFGAYDCAPQIDYIIISGGGSSTTYSAGKDSSFSSGTVAAKFSDTASDWFLGGTDDTGESDMDTKWYFDSSNGYALCRRIPSMTVSIKYGAEWWGQSVFTNITVDTLQYRSTPFSYTFHSWEPFYVDFAVGSKGGNNCVVFDSVTVTPWRGGTRGPDSHNFAESFDWTSESSQSRCARLDYPEDWIIYEGWAVTNTLGSSDYISGVAARFQYSQANTNLVQGLYSPVMTNGIGTVKFNYHVTGNSGEKVVYAVEYTTRTQAGDFGDGASYVTAATYTNTVGSGSVSGYRSCSVGTNYLYNAQGDIIEMRCRIRVIPDGTSPDAVLWIDDAYVNDFPEASDEMWRLYNGRLANAGTSSEYARIFAKSGTTLYLNNSPINDITPARGTENPFDGWMPYIQAPYLVDGIGEIAFNYRAHSATNSTTYPGSITIAVSNDSTAPVEEWTILTNITVTSTDYLRFDDPEIFQKNYHFVRFYTETNQAGRVCIDNILVMEPSRPSYDISEVTLIPEQPIFSTESNVAVRVKISRLVQSPTGIRVFASWRSGTNVWGYSNWWTNTTDGVANTVELFETETSQIYQTPEGVGLPATPANGTVQYVVWGIHDNIPEKFSDQDVIFEKQSAFTNPPWYGSVNLNDTITNSVEGATFSPYYFIYSCAPGSIWVNEAWINYNTSSNSKNKYPDGSDAYEFIELCGKAGIDVSGWTLNIYLNGKAEIDAGNKNGYSVTFDNNTIVPNDYNGWGFIVVGDDGTANLDYDISGKHPGKVDAFKTTILAVELLRDSGILEDAVHAAGGSAKIKNPNAAYSLRISDPVKGSATYAWSYALLDTPEDAKNPAYTNTVAGTASDPRVWYWTLGYPTPGEVNRNRSNVVDQSFSEIISSYYTIDAWIEEGSAYGTQNGVTTDIPITIESGASTSIVYVARSWYKIIALENNGTSVSDAIGKSVFTNTFNSIAQDYTAVVSFGPKDYTDYASASDKEKRWTDGILDWFRANGWTEEAIETGDSDKYSVWEEYWMDTDPTKFTEVSARTTSISLDGDTLYLGLGLSRTNWTSRLKATGTATAATGGLNGVVNVYGMPTLGGSVTNKVAAAQLASGAFSGTDAETTSFSTDGLGLNFFIWRIEGE